MAVSRSQSYVEGVVTNVTSITCPVEHDTDNVADLIEKGTNRRQNTSTGDTLPGWMFETCPRVKASGWSKISFKYVMPLLRLGWKRPIELADLPKLSDRDNAAEVQSRLEDGWEACLNEAGGVPTSWTLWRACYRAFKTEVILAGVFAFGESVTYICNPVIMGYFVKWIQRKGPVWEGVVLGLGLIIVSLLTGIVHHMLYYQSMKTGWNTRIAFTGLIHKRLLNLHASVSQHTSTGKILNLISTDVLRFDVFSPAIHFGWMGLLDVIVISAIICLYVGYESGLAGFAVMVTSVLISTKFAHRFFSLRQKTTLFTDSRVKTVTETLRSMLSVKAFVWEEPFRNKTQQCRSAEAGMIYRTQIMSGINTALEHVSPMIATFATFAVYTYLGNTLELTDVLVVLALYNVEKVSLGKKLTRFLESGPEAHAAMLRCQEFLMQKSFTPLKTSTGTDKTQPILSFERATFNWYENVTTDEESSNNNSSSSNNNNNNNNNNTNNNNTNNNNNNNNTNNSSSSNTTKSTITNKTIHFGDGKQENQKMLVQTQTPRKSIRGNVALSNISLECFQGDLVVIAGKVGSGKSAVLQSILGELDLISGDMQRRTKKIAYLPQNAWIMAGTVKSNILFGLAYEDDFYHQVLHACSLTHDIENLVDGENTEIGEKGINLSGGQKARVGLARAIYARADLVLLDDPLAAVDPHVARHMYDHAINGLLRGLGACVILVTHHPHFMLGANTVLFLGPGGTVEKCGKPEELDINSEGYVEKKTEKTVALAKPPRSSLAVVLDSVKAKPLEPRQVTALVLPEDRVLGVVTWSTYKDYVRSAGTLLCFTVFLLFLGSQALMITVDLTLKEWAMESSLEQTNNTHTHLGLYGALVAGTAVATITRSLCYFLCTLRAASGLHNFALKRVLTAPMAFFTSNPLGRILNRFSADQGQIDAQLPLALFEVLNIGTITIGAMALACYAIPYLLIALPLLGWYMIHVRQFTTRSLRELKRLDAMSRSPVQGAFAATCSGITTIRAFGKTEQTQKDFVEKLEINAQAWYWWLIANRWIGFRLDMMCAVLVALSVALTFAVRDSVDSGNLGLGLVYILNLSGLFQYMVRKSAEVETYLTSVERMLYYGRHIPIEDLNDSGSTNSRSRSAKAKLPDQNWPTLGAISCENLEVRYREDLPLTLKGISFNAVGGSKIGIVGRTGSGKSSLMQSLLRLNQVCGGTIMIDGKDLSQVPLHRVRQAVSLIPQEPELFSGTVRYNLDPFTNYSDEEVWAVLTEVKMNTVVDSLDMAVDERGSNFSVGQRQLLSLSRAMLRRNKIVIVDEATANVDYETDELVQHTFRHSEFFAGSTLLVIAHRINTIIDSDNILVLKDGVLEEAGSPTQLINNGGVFADMVEQSNHNRNNRGSSLAPVGEIEVEEDTSSC